LDSGWRRKRLQPLSQPKRRHARFQITVCPPLLGVHIHHGQRPLEVEVITWLLRISPGRMRRKDKYTYYAHTYYTYYALFFFSHNYSKYTSTFMLSPNTSKSNVFNGLVLHVTQNMLLLSNKTSLQMLFALIFHDVFRPASTLCSLNPFLDVSVTPMTALS
jgi:hypothetical protein